MSTAPSRWSRARPSASLEPAGDFLPGTPHGLFVLDTPVLSRWEVRVDGHALGAADRDLRGAVRGDLRQPVLAICSGEPTLTWSCSRHRSIGGGMRERIVVRSYGLEPRPVVVDSLRRRLRGPVRGKEGRVRVRARYHSEVGRRSLFFAGDASGNGQRSQFPEAAPRGARSRHLAVHA